MRSYYGIDLAGSVERFGGPEFEPRGYLTDYYTDEAIKVIEANRNRPFFLYLSHWGIHNPLQAKREEMPDLVGMAHPVITSYSIHYTKLYDFPRRIARQKVRFLDGSP